MCVLFFLCCLCEVFTVCLLFIRTMSFCWSVGEHVSFDKTVLRMTAVFEALDVSKDVSDRLPVTGLQMVCSATLPRRALLSMCHGVMVYT